MQRQRSQRPPAPQVAQLVRPGRPPQAPTPSAQPALAPRRPKRPALLKHLLWMVPLGLVGLALIALAVGVLALNLLYAERILPGVVVGNVALGNLTQAEAQQRLAQSWSSLNLRDEERTWPVTTTALGITLNDEQTAAAAFAQGHGEGGLAAFFNTEPVEPVVALDPNQLVNELIALSPNFEIVPVDAGVEFVEGQVRATPPQNGRMLDVAATVANLEANPGATLLSGELTLMMQTLTPAVTDATPLVAEAQALLNSPLDLQIYDPVTGDSIYWSALPQTWGAWLTAAPDNTSPIGLALDAEPQAVRAYLAQQAAKSFDASRSIDLDAAVQNVRAALANGQPQTAFAIVQHNERTHVVALGETITSIAWDYGIPYPYIQAANGGIAAISAGQQLIIPAADSFLLYDVVPNKRIVVDLNEQRTRVYEDGQLKWDWLSSTGIDSSPTWTGIYQVISHVPNAYAGNWNLYMPNFIGVYQPVPGADFTNGFHGFPTRGGGRLLWQNDLGRRVTYGCILLSDANVQLLYNWAEQGVVVEIRA